MEVDGQHVLAGTVSRVSSAVCGLVSCRCIIEQMFSEESYLRVNIQTFICAWSQKFYWNTFVLQAGRSGGGLND